METQRVGWGLGMDHLSLAPVDLSVSTSNAKFVMGYALALLAGIATVRLAPK
jgi:hypothetical protein